VTYVQNKILTQEAKKNATLKNQKWVLSRGPVIHRIFFANVLNEEQFVPNEEEFVHFLQKFYDIAVTVPK